MEEPTRTSKYFDEALQQAKRASIPEKSRDTYVKYYTDYELWCRKAGRF